MWSSTRARQLMYAPEAVAPKQKSSPVRVLYTSCARGHWALDVSVASGSTLLVGTAQTSWDGYSGMWHLASLPEETAFYTLQTPCAKEKTASIIIHSVTDLVAIQTTQVRLGCRQQPPQAPE